MSLVESSPLAGEEGGIPLRDEETGTPAATGEPGPTPQVSGLAWVPVGCDFRFSERFCWLCRSMTWPSSGVSFMDASA